MRHFVFLMPPLAALAAFGVVSFWRAPLGIGGRAATLALIAALAGLTARDMARLHPYQSVYFNRLIGGGVAGAAERYEMDYWCSAYKEAAEWLLAHYGQGLERKVRVAGLYAPQAATYYLTNTDAGRNRFLAVALDDNPHVVIATTRWGTWKTLPGRVLHVVEREGAPLAYVIEVKKPQPFFVKTPRPGDPRVAGPLGADEGARRP